MVVRSSELEKIKKNFNSFEFETKFSPTEYNKDYNEFGLIYLDKFVFTNHRKIELRWFQKPEKKGFYMPFHSASPRSWKRNLIIGFYHRIIKSNTTQEGLSMDLNLFHEDIKLSGYPEQFIASLSTELESIIARNGIKVSEQQTEAENEVSITVKLPYFHKQVFDRILLMKKHLKKLIKNFNLHIITTAFRAENILSKYRKLRVESENRSNLVYSFSCCCGEGEYVGETRSRLSARIRSHIHQKNLSSIYEHVTNCKPFQISYKKFRRKNGFSDTPSKLIDFCVPFFKTLRHTRETLERKFVESLIINNTKPNLNCQVKNRSIELVF